MRLTRMAWRNLGRNRRRTTVTVAAMTLSLMAMILYSGLMTGYIRGAQRNLLDLQLGDIQIHAPGYRDKPSLYARIEAPDRLVSRLRGQGFRASAYLLAGGLAAAGDASAGATFYGIDVKHVATVSSLPGQVLRGEWLDPRRPRSVVVGRRLARSLEIKLGDELVVLTQGADGSMANELYRVRGVLKSVNDAIDRTGVLMTEEAFRELMVLPEGAHRVVVRHPKNQQLEAAVARVRALAPGLEVKTWRELMPTLASMFDTVFAVMYTMFLIVSIAIGIVILNAMLMAVFERIREFGVLKALGMGPGKVLRLILCEAALQTGLAAGIGAALATPFLIYLARVGLHMDRMAGISVMGMAWDPVWRAEVSAQTFTGPILTLGFVVLVAVLYPGIKAALIRPVAAMHHR
jgi:ABC-type lipoprotein release transport system permease subunit